MASFTKYVKNKFYNQLFNASDKFVVMHRKELGFYSGWVETYDLEVKHVYARNSSTEELDFDAIVNCDISLKAWRDSNDGELRNRWLRIRCCGVLDPGIKGFRIRQVQQYEKGSNNEFKAPMSDELVPLVWKKDLDEIASSFLKNFYPQALDFPQAINPNWTIIK
ncbi:MULTISPECIES: hypothetical protein [Lactococcus]|uniref:hypothetical protein n=1 Tax=Lactococcus TaxID=1357 RepID=UPI0012AAD5DD|nr:hypothetical protein [Lactococcus lactis]QPT48071.1 hypothetical protein I6G23_00875 [Lactococcus lactis]